MFTSNPLNPSKTIILLLNFRFQSFFHFFLLSIRNPISIRDLALTVDNLIHVFVWIRKEAMETCVILERATITPEINVILDRMANKLFSCFRIDYYHRITR